MTSAEIQLVFLADVPAQARPRWEAELAALGLAPGQEDFTRPAAHVLRTSRSDPTRDTFAVVLDGTDPTCAIGIGVLQPCPPSAPAHTCAEVLLRGYSIDPRWQGNGFGATATAAAVRAARQRFPQARTMCLTVHVENRAGLRVYQRCGFVLTGRTVAGRAGPEHVMTCSLS